MNRTRKIRSEASQWLVLRETRGFTAWEHADFAEWSAEPRHAAAFAEVVAAWRALDRLAAFPHSVDRAADPDLLAASRPAWQRLAAPVLLAAAGVALTAAVVWWQPWKNGRDGVGPALVASVSPQVCPLPDGSEVELNRESEVVPVFTRTERRVRLVRGEAHFTVEKDAQRPFVVEGRGFAVRAVGTAFNVRAAGTTVEVIVTEGTVTVGHREIGPARAVTVGQRAMLPVEPGGTAAAPFIETLDPGQMDRALGWQTSRLVFEATPLREIAARINRYTAGRQLARRVIVREPEVGAMRISGRIRAGNIDGFIETLEEHFGLIAERRPGGEIDLRRK